MQIASQILLWINVGVVIYVVVVYLIYLVLILLSIPAVRRYRQALEHEHWRYTFQSPLTIGVSVIVPAYNERLTIADSVKSFLQLEYPTFEIIVVNDGSRDDTIDVLIQTFELHEVPLGIAADIPSQPVRHLYRTSRYPRLVVIDKENGGKADALNAGINVATHPLVCAVDADSLLEGGALMRITKPFLDDPTNTVAVGGIVRVANGCTIEAGRVVEIDVPRSPWALFQSVEYLRAFLFGRSGLSEIGSLLIISGAFGVFRKDIVVAGGGYRADTVGEDMELVVRMHRHLRDQKKPYKVTFLPDPVCWTEVPESGRILASQRNRWQRGLLDTLRIHRRMLLNPRYGSVGLFAFPYFVLVEALSPLIELFGYGLLTASYATGIIDLGLLLIFLMAAVLGGTLLSVMAVVLEELTFKKYPKTTDILLLVLYGLLESFGYHQLTLWWRLKGTWDYLRGSQTWGNMERRGLS